MRNADIALARELLPEDVKPVVHALDSMTVTQLRVRYRDVFKEDTTSNNRAWLRKRVGARLQELEYGGLSDRAKARVRELHVDAPIRRGGVPVGQARPVRAPRLVAVPDARRPSASPTRPERDPRLPPPGTALQREYAKETHTVVVEADGFTFRGVLYDSLSKVAKEITTTTWNGFTFFKLTKDWETR
jgi:hypothetical protein